ncbi:DEAD/DEAH box helicase, partial [bacterium]|nr:DEAD/DEAH box helicase [bacterium]
MDSVQNEDKTEEMVLNDVSEAEEPVSKKKRSKKRQKKSKASDGKVVENKDNRQDLPPLPDPVVDVSQLFPFTLDRFQLEAINAIDRNENVVVTAPTGSGKTVIAEYAIHRALTHGKRAFYTTPLKALSNQKFLDLRERYGEEKVGLLTGDISVNRNAFIVVMTTEVYRNILYGTVLGDVRSNLEFVESVIVDECHYMNDPDRGTVWEELVIYSPKNIQLISLSATVANAQDLCDWITKVHGPTTLIESSYRPVPLFINYFVGGQIYSFMNKSGKVNKLIRRCIEQVDEERRIRRKRQSYEELDLRQVRERAREENNQICEAVVRALDEKDMLPAIYFLFSRKRCDEAAKFCSRSVVKLTKEHRRQLDEAVEEAVNEHPSLNGSEHLEYIRHGVAAHHAGLLPILKTVVEDLFKRGLIKVVFATETLAAGINMPARTTIISATVKRADEGMRPLSASEFLQMSGRAGRRGMDKVGNVVIVHSHREDFEEIVSLVKSSADPLISHYTPSYGMVLNLLQVHTKEEAKSLVEKSFGQFIIEQH